MKIEIRADSAVISGYVNAVGRDSRMIPSARGAFVEQVMPKTFERALAMATNVELRVNHSKVVGQTSDGTLKLHEDNIGLYAQATVTDAETIKKAKQGEFSGWSFGFQKKADAWEVRADGVARRLLKDISILEVSLIDMAKTPAYVGTTVEVRENVELHCEHRYLEDMAKVEVTEQSTAPATEQADKQATSLLRMKQKTQYLKLKGKNT